MNKIILNNIDYTKSKPLYINACKVCRILNDNGYKAFMVGGFPRDLVLNKYSDDIDIATDATPTEIIKLFRKTIPVGAQFGVVIVLIGPFKYQVSTFRKDIDYKDGRRPTAVEFTDECEDVKRRDFTINGLIFNPNTSEIIDYVGGLEDIKLKILKAIDDPLKRFEEDKLRMIRAIRFSANLGFAIEENTYLAIKSMAKKIHEVSAERIREELEKMLTRENPEKAILLLDESSLLSEILPEISVLKEIEQPKEFHPEGNVFNHIIKMLKLSSIHSPLALKMAVILHDIGKAKTFENTDRIRFNNHDKISAMMSKEILKRLKFSNDEIENIVALVEHHMQFMDVQKMKISTFRKFINIPNFDQHLELHRLDCESSHRKLANYDFTKNKIKELEKSSLSKLPIKFINGDDLISLGIKPSPLFGKILKYCYDKQLEGLFPDKDNAILWLKNNLHLLNEQSFKETK